MNQKSVVVILGVVAIVLIGTTVYFATINKAIQPVAPAPKVVQQPVPAPTVQQPAQSAPVDETASWQTYKNDKFGYEVKYPQNWNYKVENNLACFRENGKKYNIEESDQCGISISETTNLDTKRLSAQDWAKQKKEKGGATITEMKIAGFNAIQSQDYLGLETIVSKPVSNGLEIDIATPNFGDEALNKQVKIVYEKMLSTLKFTK